MVAENAVEIPSSMPRPTTIHDAWMADAPEPHQQGLAVIDTGATETVTSLTALEAIHRRRTEVLGHSEHVEVVNKPGKTFRFWKWHDTIFRVFRLHQAVGWKP